MYFPYLRGRQFELIALRELIEKERISGKIIPIIEPIKPTATLLKTLNEFARKNRRVAVISNPQVGDFEQELNVKCNEGEQVAIDLKKMLSKSNTIIKAFIMNDNVADVIKNSDDKSLYLIINENRDNLNKYLEAYDSEFPQYTLIPDDRACRRLVTNGKVLLEDCFVKRGRNVEYIENDDEFFTDNHLFFRDDNYIGFSDYSIVGRDYSETGFVPIAVAIHLVYFDNNNEMRIHHFVSDSNIGTKDPAGKFGEALKKLVKWCDKKDITKTDGLKQFYNCYKEGKYPGLGSVKKMSIMHNIELMSDFLEDEK